MKWYLRRRFIILAALTVGTTLQLSACQSELALLGMRILFTTFTLPLNDFVRQFFLGLV